jgi:HEAT repeat protein
VEIPESVDFGFVAVTMRRSVSSPKGGPKFAHETKGEIVRKEESVIVEAFGNRRCAKLIEQVMSEDAVTRNNALAVLCDEMHNPLSVQGCVESGMVQVLNNYIAKSEDPQTKERASKALSIAAMDANGRNAMLSTESAAEIQPGVDDSNVEVRRNVYESLVNFTKGTLPNLKSVIAARYPSILVSKAAAETPEVQPLVLKLLYNCIKDESGLEDSLQAGGTKTCIQLLASENVNVRKEAANTLCFLCFTESAKQDAITNGAVSILCGLLKDKSYDVISAAAGALMAITTTDEGKREFVPAEGAEAVMGLLACNESRSVRLNILKVICNIAVHPTIRKQLRDDPRVLPALEDFELGADTLVAKHASIAMSAVLWEP